MAGKTELAYVEQVTSNVEAEKANNHSGDVALKALSDPTIVEAIDPQAEKRLVRKIDRYVIPFICVTYLVTYIDKATLGYGKY